MVRHHWTTAAFAASGIVIGACSPMSVAGAPSPAPSSGTNVGTSFDICTTFTAADIRSYGLDPASKRETTSENGGLAQSCDWSNDSVDVSFILTSRTVASLKDDKSYLSTSVVHVGDRESVLIVQDSTPGGCGIGMPAGSKSVILSLSVKYGALSTAGDPCTLVSDLANKVVTKIPR